MFLSKIWWFLVTLIATVALAVAFVAFRPGQRELQEEEKTLLLRSQQTVDLILRDNATKWLALTAQGAVDGQLVDALDAASHGGADLAKLHETVQARLQVFADQMKAQNDWIFLAVDASGRAIARVDLAQASWRDVLVGYPAVESALRGYRVEDTWDVAGQLYRITAAPVVQRSAGRYVGALLVGVPVDAALAEAVHKAADVDIAFFVRGQLAATSLPLPALADLPGKFDAALGLVSTAGHTDVLPLGGDGNRFMAVAAPLAGEAHLHDAFFAVFAKRRSVAGLTGVLKDVARADLQGFPYVPIGAGFVIVLLVGMLFLQLEGPGPVGRLLIEVQSLRKGEKNRVEDTKFGGKFGSLARAVNGALDRFAQSGGERGRGKSLDAILGEPPSPASKPAISLSPLPPATLGASPPPPLTQAKSPTAKSGARTPPPPPPNAPGGGVAGLDLLPPPPPPPDVGISLGSLGLAPPPPAAGLGLDALALPGGFHAAPSRVPAPMVGGKSGAIMLPDSALDDLELPPPPPGAGSASGGGHGNGAALGGAEAGAAGEAEYPRIFDAFVELKKKCGESVDGLGFDKFVSKLRGNRDQLVAKHGCREVKFEVYVKEGKAALKATPVK